MLVAGRPDVTTIFLMTNINMKGSPRAELSLPPPPAVVCSPRSAKCCVLATLYSCLRIQFSSKNPCSCLLQAKQLDLFNYGLVAFKKKLNSVLYCLVISLGVNVWLLITRSRVRFPALLQCYMWIRSRMGCTQPREDNWVATWLWSSGSDYESRHY